MSYGYPRPRATHRNAGLAVTFDRTNVSDVVDAASGTLAHGVLPPAISQAMSDGISQGVNRALPALALLGLAFLFASHRLSKAIR
jgi:hypothetical protein